MCLVRSSASWWLALELAELSFARHAWNDGKWYDATQDFNVAVPICRVDAEATPPYCPDMPWHYFNGSCWRALTVECEWREAVATCGEKEQLHSYLATVSSAQENDLVQNICGERICWLGLREKPGLEDAYEWMDGRPVTYANWHQGEPSNFKGMDDNVVIMNFGWKRYKTLEKMGGWADGDWFDVSGGFNKPSPLCERGLPHRGKRSFCPGGWDWHGDSCYHLMDLNCTSAQAAAVCEQEGGHLVTIGSEEEQAFVRSLCGLRMCWLGLKQSASSKAWVWIDGSPMVFANWARGEPNDFGGHEHHAMMNLDASWMFGKGSRWRHPSRKKQLAAVQEQLATKLTRLGTMTLFSVAYMAAYIVRLCFGIRIPGGPLAAVSAVIVVVVAGGLLDHLLPRHPGAVMGFLLAIAAVEGLYIGGVHTGLCTASGRRDDINSDPRTPPLQSLE